MENASSPAGPEGVEYVHRDVVVIGASAGGVEALENFVVGLPAEVPASLFVVLHLMSPGTSVLPAILARAGRLPAAPVRDGERYERGQIYVAPPDHHMLIQGDSIALTRGPRENGHRPAVDPLFRSAARGHGPRVVAVILSGSLDDGVAGMRLVKDYGGAALVQDPDEALYDGMPRAAVTNVDVDHVAPVRELAKILCNVLDEPVELREDTGPVADEVREEAAVDALVDLNPNGAPSGLTCPECGGGLWEQGEGPMVSFQCRVGHAFSPESLVTEQGKALEEALWGALQSLEERADLLRRMARRAKAPAADRFERRAQAAQHHASVVRSAVAQFAEGPSRRPDPLTNEPDPA